ncbi:membrane protein insertase YidC [Nocardioides sp. URHA0020]|uniref:membrane protein insertase YidC n=1 Tax=Nocardioides sp. URHA0020 TaxID=1380392 RepID=UPI00056307A7|nr:membrane protein insertase YidC [Nocardioides sp. URHA0020]
MGALGDLGGLIMTPLYYAISAVLVAWHWMLTQIGLDPDSGLTWVLSVIGLTLTVRAALIPLFVKQIKSSRNMQLIQPKVKELQKKYGHDRERLAQETMKLYKESGTNPFASCLPILIQMPIFLALFRLLDHHAAKGDGKAFITTELAHSFQNAELFGVIPLKATFLKADGSTAVMVVAALLVIAMTATTFTTQRQLMSKNMPADALSGPYAQQQKLLLYVLPVVFAVGGIAFPIAVLFYWTTSNLWTMGQQFYVIRNNPAPGTAAETAKKERDRLKAEKHGRKVEPEAEALPVVEEPRPQARQQPKKQSKKQRKQTPGQRPSPTPKPKTEGGTDA